jgi:flagellar FliJ protein
MKAFRFTLQSILALRERAEQQAQQHCAAAQSTHDKALDMVLQAEGQLQTSWNLVNATCMRGAPAAEIMRLNAWSAAAQEELRRTQAHAETTRTSLEKSRSQLKQATQKRQVLDNLKAKRRAVHQQEFLRAEQKQLDEVAGRRRSQHASAESGQFEAQLER